MGLTSALNTSFNGLVLNETTIDVVGNNIANAGTNGFKASNVLFATQLSRTLGTGSRPTATNGGTNPRQIGLGATTASIVKDFTQGSITNTTSPSDIAIQGDGFFVVDGADGNAYSRNGNFDLNSANKLVTAQGFRVQGYGVDSEFNLLTTQLTDITIPLGTLNAAQQTQNVTMNGALRATGTVATQGTHILSEALTDTSGGAAATNPITAATSLTSVYQNGSTTALFTNGQTVTFTARKGGRSIQPVSLAVSGTTTVQDLLTAMDHGLGIASTGTPALPDDPNKLPAAGPPGVDVVAGQIQFTGNRGSLNDFEFSIGDLTSNGSTVPISFTKDGTADGESAVTDFIIYDSLGQQVTVKMAAVLESVTNTASTFRWFVESADDSDTDIVVNNGTLVFDSRGVVTSGGTASFSIDRETTAALSPMQITLDLSTVSGISTDAGSTLSLQTQNGSSPGTLTSFAIAENGVINGIFDNGISRDLGQITLARFANSQGLIESGSNTFKEGPSSGTPTIAVPGTQGLGTLRSGAIELSNTDIGRNLVDLIVASTNYRGNARVISSVQQLVDELLILGR